MTRARKLAFGLLSTLSLLLIVELGLRAIIPREKLLFSWEKPNGVLFAQASGRTTMNPNQSTTRMDGPHEWTMRINSQGFREKAEIPFEKPPGQLRWLALGDSWMVGFNADDGHSLPDLLEEKLPEILGQPVEVINNGQFGGSAFDMLVAWRAAQSLQPDAVLMGWPHNGWRQEDLHDVRQQWYARTRPAPQSDARLYLLTRLALYRLTRPVQPELSGQQINEALADLSVIAREAQGLNIPVYLVIWPTQYNGRMDAGEAEFLVQSLRPLGVRFAGHSLAQRSCWGYEDLFHPSEAGYAAVAQRVLSLIRDGESSLIVAANPSCNEVPADGPGK